MVKPRIKHILFETHAIRRMRKRGISEEQVEKVVLNPEVSRPAKREGARHLEKAFSKNRRLIVIAEFESDFVRIITAMWR